MERSDSDIHSEGQDLPLTKLTNTVKCNYIFEIEILDTMIDDAFKKSAGYKYYRAKKVESDKAKADDEPEEQHESLVKNTDEEKHVETDDSDDFDIDLSENEPYRDYDATGFGVFVYKKSTEPLKSTYLRWFMKKSRSVNAMRRTTWFDLLLKSNIDQNEDHIVETSIVVIEKKFKVVIQKNKLTIADLEGAGLEKLKLHHKNDVELAYHVFQLKEAVLSKAQWNSDEGDVSKPRSFECHMSKSSKPYPSFYNSDFYCLVYLSTEEKYTTSLTKHYAARYYIQGIKDIVLDIWSKEVHRYLIEAMNIIHQ
nr:hypothetical protein [Tanacetum cinerariifolium]